MYGAVTFMYACMQCTRTTPNRQMKPEAIDDVKYTGYQTQFLEGKKENCDAKMSSHDIIQPKGTGGKKSSLLSRGPHLIHSRLNIVSLGFGALGSPDVGAWIVHMAHCGR